MKSPATPTLEIESKITGTTYRIHLPADAATSGPKVPLMLITDGDDQFKPALAAYEKLRAARKIEALLLVGIGYGGSYRSPKNRRMRDYTPTVMKGEEGTGGAEPFRIAVRDEIIPLLEAQFPLKREERGIAGHSLGSLFGLYAFFQDESLFTRALLSAPSIWYDDRSVLKIEEAFSHRHRALAAKLFLSSGEDDSPSMKADLLLLEQALAAHPYAGLEVTSRRFADRDHYNVLPEAFEAGLEALYGK
jgi:predicted alpha/beta superfamily hydrolase